MGLVRGEGNFGLLGSAFPARASPVPPGRPRAARQQHATTPTPICVSKSAPARGGGQPTMDESMLLQRRALLQQQLSLLDDRCAATSKILGRKTQGAKARRRLEAARSGNPAVAANARGAGPPRRALAEAATTFHREAPPSTIVRPRPKPGGPQESLRLTQLMRRTARHVDVAKQVQLRRPKRGPVPRRAG